VREGEKEPSFNLTLPNTDNFLKYFTDRRSSKLAGSLFCFSIIATSFLVNKGEYIYNH